MIPYLIFILAVLQTWVNEIQAVELTNIVQFKKYFSC
jgi:hypothetical protein